MPPRDPQDLRAALIAALARPGRASSDYDLNAGLRGGSRDLTPAAVLVAITSGADPHVVLTKREAALRNHPGQIAFAGGKADPTDRSARHTAMREAHEEIGLSPEMVDVLGELPSHETVTGFSATPVVALIDPAFVPRPEPGEVAEVFTVPLRFLLDPANYRVEGRFWRGHKRLYYAVPYGPYYIWGATARMLRAFADQVAK